MITIQFTDTSLHISGHAGCGPAGQDIVCAGVSTLYNTVVLNLLALSEEGVCAVAYDPAPGKAWVAATPVRWQEATVKNVFHVIGIGLRAMAEQYSQYLTIS